MVGKEIVGVVYGDDVVWMFGVCFDCGVDV